MAQSRKRGFQDLPVELLATTLAFIPCLKARLGLATVAKQWLAALARADSYSRGCSSRRQKGNPLGKVDFHGPDPPLLQQDVLAALAASGMEFCFSRGFTSWAWLPPTVRRLSIRLDSRECPPADCPTLACVEELRVDFLGACTALDVTKFPSARVLKASLHYDEGQVLKPVAIPWLAQLAALPQLTKVKLDWGESIPGKFLTQLPAGCKLVIDQVDTGDTLEDSLPHHASLAHLVALNVDSCDPMTEVDFSCLASCPNLRNVRLVFEDEYKYEDLKHLRPWVDLSTLNHLPTHCSVVLGFRGAARRINEYQPPAGWSVAPDKSSRKKLILSRTGSAVSMNS